ncbi:hypothetical protein SAMN05443545_101291 [Aidingimonas halophila]|uniref:Uncharacterized protein n=1 Tax=Aidingimonas halophila TaxID=574349 RepID=A0A1H2RE25_9GAMM|nr:hypothetical protein GCM10008094_06810 [Aidingimonas halophila]SDW17410.1 hypothetical protein SAMN05443545_101291 [Aidingimonas halophila]
MPTVEALTGFDHHGPRRRGAQWSASDQTAKDLSRAGLVRILPDPAKAPAQRSSASPQGRASRQTTAGASKRGGKRGTQKGGSGK